MALEAVEAEKVSTSNALHRFSVKTRVTTTQTHKIEIGVNFLANLLMWDRIFGQKRSKIKIGQKSKAVKNQNRFSFFHIVNDKNYALKKKKQAFGSSKDVLEKTKAAWS